MQFTPFSSTPMPANVNSAMISDMPHAGTGTNGLGGMNGHSGLNGLNGAIGTNLVFGNANRKRSLEILDDDWSPTPGTTDTTPVLQQGSQMGLALPGMGMGMSELDKGLGGAGPKKEVKKAKKA